MSTISLTPGMKPRSVFQNANVISDPIHLESAWLALYQRLARSFADLLRSNTGYLVEIGCGRGQLTIPLSGLVANSPIIVVDKFAGPYSKDCKSLRVALGGRSWEGGLIWWSLTIHAGCIDSPTTSATPLFRMSFYAKSIPWRCVDFSQNAIVS